ncbi:MULTISPECIES: hypothetical protein [unclassified Rhizobium]|uniref:hypothetical protein n=1 Tax=unclassified Rhizobium TaxID=2613769 RepID=UPI001FFE189D|nr:MULTISPECIES: hypothetical protein [unclassified Rhizobium]
MASLLKTKCRSVAILNSCRVDVGFQEHALLCALLGSHQHRERGAYLYVRQSSMRQVIDNTESAMRQYALRGRAIALGWREELIIVNDNDQGGSGASAV